jgi:transcriptional regulator with XRE-family HTH domain
MNTALVAARASRHLSQEELARRLGVSKRTVQRWEEVPIPSRPRPAQVRSLQANLGMPIEQLGFPPDKNAIAVQDGRGGLDLEMRLPPPLPAAQQVPAGNYSGIWISRYDYVSSSREQQFTGLHHVVVQQDDNRISVRSLPKSANSSMGMDLTVDGNILTGTWVEDTDKTGYYRGKRYHGAIQLIADGSGSRLAGKWLGYGKDNEINSGPWQLDYLARLSKATLEEYDRLPND